MANKNQYVQRFKRLHQQKAGVEVSDLEALEHFERLVLLVRTITSHAPISSFIHHSNE